MRIGITGVTGLIGKKLAARCQAHGHRVVGFSRQPQKTAPHCDETRLFSLSKTVHLENLDAVIHLAGEPVIGLWTRAKRERIVASRRETTRHLVAGLAKLEEKPSVFLCASGTGFYGNRAADKLDEDAPPGRGFLAEVAQIWEKEAVVSATLGIRTAQLRTGMVLAKEGGAFPLLRQIYKLGAGGKLGSGEQFMPWIHVDDVVSLYLFCLENASLSGPINAVAPQEINNRDFTRTLAGAVHRPAIFGVPSLIVQAALGELSTLVLDSQRVVPARALVAGFRFAFPTLDAALANLLR